MTSSGNRLAFLALVSLLVTASGCSSSVPKPPEFDRSVNFGRYWVYSWTMPPKKSSSSDVELLDWRIRTAVDGELALKGRRKRVSGEDADFLVEYRLAVEEGTIDTFGDWFNYRKAGGAGSPSEAYTQGYEEVVLVLEIFDARSRQLVWRAAATAVVDTEQVHEQNKRVDEAVREMLIGFPPR